MITYFSGFFIVLCFAVFVLYIAIESVRMRRGGQRKFEVRFWGFVVAFILILAFRRWLDAHSGPTFWRQTLATNILADVAALFGVTLAVWSRHALGQSWSSEVVIQEEHELIERGPYALVRHPMYGGLLLMLFGAAVYYGKCLWVVVFGWCFFGLWIKSHREEGLLAKTFPDYEGYRKRTKAFIPFLW